MRVLIGPNPGLLIVVAGLTDIRLAQLLCTDLSVGNRERVEIARA